jgi:hypothetical protein
MSDSSVSVISADSSSVGKEFSTSILYCTNEFPSDDLQGIFNCLQRHARDGKFPFLSSFLTGCTRMVKKEVAGLPQDLQESLPPFQNVLALAVHFANNRHGPLAGALDGALLCILQIGILIGYVSFASCVVVGAISNCHSMSSNSRPTQTP